MNEPAVALSDFAITLLCVIFCWKMWSFPVERKKLQINFMGLFASVGLAALWGGLVHGFLPPEDSTWTTTLWVATLITVGVSSYNLWMINFELLYSQNLMTWGRWVVRILFLVYVCVALFITQEFYIAIISYIPPAIVLFLLLLLQVVRSPTRFNFLGLAGLILTFVAAYVQQAQIGLHPEYLNHNTLYHLIQALGLWGLYFFGSRACRWRS